MAVVSPFAAAEMTGNGNRFSDFLTVFIICFSLQIPVSYTHLDVYKRQAGGLQNRPYQDKLESIQLHHLQVVHDLSLIHI